MCEPVTAGLLLSAVGGGTKFVNNQAALRRQDREASEGIRRQSRIQGEANTRVNEQIQDIDASTGDVERGQSLDGFLTALREAESSTTGALPTIAGANKRFAENVEAGKAGLAKGGAERAGRLSRIDAPRFQRINEAGRIGRTATDLNETGRQSRAEDFLTRLRVASERPNEFIDVLGSIASGAGSALTLGTGSGVNFAKLLKEGTLVDAPIRAASPFAGVPA
jgi:hypothetical protein